MISFRYSTFSLIAVALGLAAINLQAAESYEGDARPNFILMIGDDMAVETLNCYNVGSDVAVTPNLDNLCDEGLRFDNFWSQPVCSPTRATLLTGQYGFANGVGSPVSGVPGVEWTLPNQNNNAGGMGAPNAMGGPNAMGNPQLAAGVDPEAEAPESGALKPDAYTFIQALSSSGYQTAAVGKWHLANGENGGLAHPLRVGFDHYSGGIRGGGVAEFDAWNKVVDGGDPTFETDYVTTVTVEDGKNWLSGIDPNQPFFLWVAFNAPHTPFHMPPAELLSTETANIDPAEASSRQQYLAMIEAMDTEIGNLLASLDDETRNNTYVLFMGDNGTPRQVVGDPFPRSRAKSTVYQGGVNVPFIVSGPGIEADQTTQALANSVDMFDTVLELSGVEPEQDTALHSVSLVPILTQDTETQVRHFAYADVFGPTRSGAAGSRAIRNSEYKLIHHFLLDQTEFYKLSSDPYEANNLLETGLSSQDQAAYDQLVSELEGLLNP